MKFIWDLGTIIVLLFLVVLMIATIAFLFIKKNELFGLRVHESIATEEVWHKVHIIVAVCDIPFIIGYGILLFVNNAILKLMLSMFLIVLVIIVWSIVPSVVTKKARKEKSEQEIKELEETRKRESGWIK